MSELHRKRQKEDEGESFGGRCGRWNQEAVAKR
jgi:hypothetical protein